MTNDAPAPRAVDKRQAIVAGALRVFGRDGYARASMDAIAAEAAVSTRTIYNHFIDKKSLFLFVIQASATHVADAQVALMDRYLHKITDLEADLVEFGLAWVTPMADFPDHFALVRQMTAEVGHLPHELIERWQDAGPRRVMRELALRLEALADRGLLLIDDSDRAANHFVLLAAWDVTDRSYYGAIPLEQATVERIVRSGVHAFLHGYLPARSHVHGR
ncbi:TetR/AcrR family transcriptional regulator [Blastococcus sp. SYSU DS0552]